VTSQQQQYRCSSTVAAVQVAAWQQRQQQQQQQHDTGLGTVEAAFSGWHDQAAAYNAPVTPLKYYAFIDLHIYLCSGPVK
jgi:hypothetical protein